MKSYSRSADPGNLTLAAPEPRSQNPLDNEDDLKDFLENAPLAVHLVDADGKIIWANKAQLEYLGYSYDEYVGRAVGEIHADKDNLAEILAILRNGGSIKDREVLLKHKDGSIRIGSISSNVRLVDGNFAHTRCFTRDITEERKAERDFSAYFEKAESTKRLYEAVLSSISDFNQAYDRDGRIIYVNQALLELWGLTLEDVIGKDFFDLNYPPELAQRLREQIKQVFETREGLTDQTPYTSPSGKEGYYEYIFRPVLSPEGNVEMVVGSTRDISDHKRAIAELKETQEILKIAMLSSRMGAWSCDVATDEVYWTPELEAIFGLEPGQFPGYEGAFREMVYEEDREIVERSIATALAERSEYDMQFRFRHADGSIRWMEGRGRAYYSEDGTPQRIFGIGIDITERKRHEELVRESDRSLKEMADSFPQLAWIANADGYIFWYNRRWFEYTGTTIDQMEGWGWQSVHDPKVLPDVLKNWSRAIKRGEEFEMEFPLRRSDGKFEWFLTRAVPFRNSNGDLMRWFGTNTNIEEIWNIRRRSEEANRAKDEFLAILSHELRAPLNLISGWVQVLKNQAHEPETVMSAIDVVSKNVALQSNLIDGLIDASRIVSGDVELEQASLRIEPIVLSSIESARAEAEKKKIRLDHHLEAAAAEVKGDAVRLKQVVSNILNNALKFTSEGGRVDVSLTENDSLVRLSIKDDGIGIAEEALPFVFERFRQADTTSKRTYGGLGLGLAIVERLITLHGGKIEARSEGKDMGSEFIVELPLIGNGSAAGKQDAAEDRRKQAAAGTKLDGMRILVVDDDRDALELMYMFLQIEGANVTKANSAAEALEVISDAAYDLLVSDLGMPEMDGYELIRSVRTKYGHDQLPAIALTGYVSEKDQVRVTSAGFQAHLPKPVEFADLIGKIHELRRD